MTTLQTHNGAQSRLSYFPHLQLSPASIAHGFMIHSYNSLILLLPLEAVGWDPPLVVDFVNAPL